MRVLFRTEGGHAQGMGDVCGSLALAHAFRSLGADVLLVITEDPEARALIQQEGYPLLTVGAKEEGVRELASIGQYAPDAIIVNRLNNPPGYLRAIKPLGRFLVVLDDTSPEARLADLNINVLYKLAGAISDAGYIALREEVRAYHGQTRVMLEVVSKILVSQGGSDTYGFTPMIVTALKKVLGDFSVTVVTGWAFSHFAELDRALDGDQRFLVLHGARNMADLMMASDLAVTGGGNTMFELACVGTPSIVVCGEEFEEETAQWLADQGVVVNLGFGGRLSPEAIAQAVQELMASPEARRRMSGRGKELVDGQGAMKIAHLVLERLAAREVAR